MENQIFTFKWIIENSPYCWHKKGSFLDSPVFVVNSLVKSKWCLRIYPRGNKFCTDVSPVYLRRINSDDGPEYITLTYDLSHLDENGSSVLTEKIQEHSFARDHGYGATGILSQDDVFRSGKVTICCKIWNNDQPSPKASHCLAITKLGRESKSFVWEIKEFSNLMPDQERLIDIKSESTGVQKFLLKFLLMEGLGHDENLCLEAVSTNEKIRIQAFRLFLVDATGDKIKCSLDEKVFCTTGKRYLLPLVFSKRQLMENTDQYLPENTLRLLCELSYSTGIVLEEISIKEACLQEQEPFDRDLNAPGKNISNTLEGLQSLYYDKIMCDVKIRTNTEVFPCHRTILSAASPVFRSMFTNPMKEKTSEFVDIPDLDGSIVQRMLIYLYTGILEDLSWGIASKLFAAADKYQIMPLKDKCVLFLKANVSITNACEGLILADLHQDNELKRVIQNFILDHSSSIISSKDWRKLMINNIQLAAETMHLKWLKEQLNNDSSILSAWSVS